MYPKRPKIGLFFRKLFTGGLFLCTPSNWPKAGGQIWGPSAFKTRQAVWKPDQLGSARSSAELPHDSSPSATLKVRRPQFAAAGREAACGVHYAARSADWHTHAWGVIGGTRYDSWRVDCMRGHWAVAVLCRIFAA